MMKPAMQALRISPDSQSRAAIVSGRITTTIRVHQRNYRPGPVMLCCHLEPWAVMATIVAVKHCTLSQVSREDMLAGGYRSREELVNALLTYYPDADDDSPVTVIRWDANSLGGKFVDSPTAHQEHLDRLARRTDVS